ncbi:hypothetical protein OXX59_003244 [Metschnikowia pulcherrima]
MRFLDVLLITGLYALRSVYASPSSKDTPVTEVLEYTATPVAIAAIPTIPPEDPLENALSGLHIFAQPNHQDTARPQRFRNIRFVIPPLNTVRNPITIITDVGSLSWSLRTNNPSREDCNSRLQRLLFERLLWPDSPSEIQTTMGIDGLFRETYEALYNPEGLHSVLTEERRAELGLAATNLLNLRLPLITILHTNASRIDTLGLQLFVNYLRSMETSLDLPIHTNIPEERLVMDMLRGLRVISGRVSELIRNASPRTASSSGTGSVRHTCSHESNAEEATCTLSAPINGHI